MYSSTWWEKKRRLAAYKQEAFRDATRIRQEREDRDFWKGVVRRKRGLSDYEGVDAGFIGEAKRQQTLEVAGKTLYFHVEKVLALPGGIESDWSREANHYLVVIQREGQNISMCFGYSMGSGLSGKWPKASNVLSSLALDARCGMVSFMDYCGEFGEDSDSRKAYKLWERCVETYEWIVAVGVRDVIDFDDEMWEGLAETIR